MKPCKHTKKIRINKQPFKDANGDKGYIADVKCQKCDEIVKRDERTITNFFRDSGLF